MIIMINSEIINYYKHDLINNYGRQPPGASGNLNPKLALKFIELKFQLDPARRQKISRWAIARAIQLGPADTYMT
jgi:hypothetical protein